MNSGNSIILIDPEDEARNILVERLRMQGYKTTGFAGPVEGVNAALSTPPSLVIADLWMSGISGVQLTRLLRAEAATDRVPVILRGPDSPRNRFWAERAGAEAYVVKGRMGDLVRAIARSSAPLTTEDDGFFTQLQDAESAIRDRIAAYLDAALFESVLAVEVRALSMCGAFDRLFDLLTQFVSQVMSYRWLALSIKTPFHLGLHCHPAARQESENEVRTALGLPKDSENTLFRIEDEDASPDKVASPPIVRAVHFGEAILARLAISQKEPGDSQDQRIVDIIARELGGPLRMTLLVEETQRAATTDPLTGLMNRRAFLSQLELEKSRSERNGYPMSLLLLDVDHFKAINDRRGHAMGDQVLASLGKLLIHQTRKIDIVGRWGGEEFVIVLSGSDESGAKIVAERIRLATEEMMIQDDLGQRIPVTISIGIACLEVNDSAELLLDRADRAMYQAKTAGRNRVIVSPVAVRRTGTALMIPAEIA